MKYYFAPMESITGYIYRRAYAECFHPLDKYFTPFLVPGTKRVFRDKEIRDILPENNVGLCLVPQLLCNRSEDFIRGAKELWHYGYREINLNLGCPSGTVMSKEKGAGFLKDPDRLDAFFEQVFSNLDLDMKISVKTRIGIFKAEEFETLLQVYNRYPISELIVHARLQKDYYKGKPDLTAFSMAVRESKNPLCYNGNLFTVQDVENFTREFQGVDRLMLGRGILGNPALINELKGEASLTADSFMNFHGRLVEEYGGIYSGEKDVLFRMKELWFYMSHMFSNSEKYMKKIRKAGTLLAYEEAVRELIQNQEIVAGAGFSFQ